MNQNVVASDAAGSPQVGRGAAGKPHQRSAATAALMEMIVGYQASRAISAAAALGIADLLADEPRSVTELAEATRTRPPLLYRLLRALAGRGIFSEREDGRFELTTLAEPLRSEAPGGSVRGFALLVGEAFAQRPWDQLLETLRSGKPGFELAYGTSLFDYLANDREAGETFNEAMRSNTSRDIDAVLDAYDFARYETVVDVAGGHGGFIAAVLSANPRIRGVLFDLPHVISGATAPVGRTAAPRRCDFIAGDMFASVPSGGDAYVLKRTIHDWDDERARLILDNCRRAMNRGGRILVVDMLIPPGNRDHPAKLYDLLMMVMIGGRERNRPEFEQLFASAGLKVTQIIATRSPLRIIEGEAAP